MNPHQYIRKEWIVSPAARRMYRAAAAISLTLYVSLVWVVVNGGTPLARRFLFIGLLAMSLTGAAMEAFLFFFDDSPAWKQIFWFVVMIFAPLGPALFCFFVYSRSNALRAACAKPSDAMLNDAKTGI
jgi:hypothetical protein